MQNVITKIPRLHSNRVKLSLLWLLSLPPKSLYRLDASLPWCCTGLCSELKAFIERTQHRKTHQCTDFRMVKFSGNVSSDNSPPPHLSLSPRIKPQHPPASLPTPQHPKHHPPRSVAHAPASHHYKPRSSPKYSPTYSPPR